MEKNITNKIFGTTLSDIELERNILGALIIDDRSFDKVKDILKPEMFFSEQNRTIYLTICETHEQYGNIDLFSVTSQAKANKTLDGIGGMVALTDLTYRVASAAHIESWSYILSEKYCRRIMMKALNDMTKSVIDDDISIDSIFDLVSSTMEDARNLVSAGAMMNPIGCGVKEAYESLFKRTHDRRNGIFSFGITTGLRDLDDKTGGWKNDELTVVAARPSMGKTAMMIHFARSAAESGKSVCIFSLEMSKRQIADRMIIGSLDYYVTSDQYAKGDLSEEQLKYVSGMIDGLSNSSIYVDDKAAVTMNYIHAKARKMKEVGKCDLVMIDYLQLASETNQIKNRNREQEIAQMSRQAKIMAKDLDIPVLLLSQLSRAVESRSDKRPLLSDLRESGAIEQDADNVIFIYRPSYYNITHTDSGTEIPKNAGELIIAKCRNGKTGSVAFSHNESITRIYNYNEYTL